MKVPTKLPFDLRGLVVRVIVVAAHHQPSRVSHGKWHLTLKIEVFQ